MSWFRRRLMMAGKKELPNYLCFEALEAGTITLNIAADVSTTNLAYVEYSKDDGATWTKTNNVASTEVTITTPNLSSGDKVYWRGSGVKYATSTSVYSKFSSTCNCNLSGNIASLVYPSNWENYYGSWTRDGNKYSFTYLFRDMTKLKDSSALVLPFTKLSESCYRGLFYGCSAMVTPPSELPCVNLKTNYPYYCYAEMFRGCSAMTSIPDIKATSITGNAYREMFYSCTSLVDCSALTIPTDVQSTLNCYAMFRECTSLKKAPVMPLLTLVAQMYRYMFYNCTSLEWVKMLATNITASNCLGAWMQYAKNESTCVFVKNISATWTTTGNSGVPTNWKIIYFDTSDSKYYTDQQKTHQCDDHGNIIS